MKKITSLIFCLCGLFFLSTESRALTTAKARLPFIANKGQVHESVRFYAPIFSGTVFVTADGDIVYSLQKADKRTAITETFIGASIRAITGEGESITKVSDFRGKDPSKWRSGISAYDSLDLGEIYSGVNLNLKAYGNNVEKLFRLSPGATPEALKIRLRGATSLRVNNAGELEAETLLGTVTFTKPVAYQEIPPASDAAESRKNSPLEGGMGGVCSAQRADCLRETPPLAPLNGGVKTYIDISYLVNGDEYGFKTGDYDREYPLFIDPMLAATFFGGSDDEFAAIALDKEGNVYAVGETYSSDFPSTSGSYDQSRNTGSDVFVSKFSADLTTLLISTFLGGAGNDAAYSVILDSGGNVYVSGETSSSDFPTTPNAYDTTPSAAASDRDAFVVKLDADLTTLSASTLIGGKGDETCTALLSDGNGGVYIAGDTTSSDFPITAGVFDETYNSGTVSGGDIFISKFDTNLTTLSASTFLGRGGRDVVGVALASDGKGNLYVSGQTRSSAFPTTPGAYNETFTGDNDNVFISKISGDLKTLLASTFIGGNADSSFAALDKAGNVYVAGGTFSSDFPTTSGVYDETFNSSEGAGSDAFISKLDGNLTTLLASTFFGGSDAEFVNGIVLDQKGKIYVSGMTSSADFPTTSVAYDRSFNGGGDIFLSGDVFVSVFDSDLKTLSASTFLGGSADDWSNSLVLTENGNICVSGGTYSSDFPISSAGYDKTFGGKSDAFVVKLDSCLSALPSLFNFETATNEGWEASARKGELGVSGVNVSSEQAYSGEYALAMNVHLNAADADLSSGTASVMVPGDMAGRPITAWVKFPKGATGDPAHPNGVQLFVKDQDFRIQMSPWRNIGSDIPEEQWTQIELTPATTAPTGGYTDAGFDPSQVIVVGVKVGAGTGSQTRFQGLCWLDVVTVDAAPMTVPESDHVFNFDSLTPEQQAQKPFGYGPYWNADPNWGTAFRSEDITVQNGSLAVNANFMTASETARKAYIGVTLQPNLDIGNKKNRLIRAEIKFDSYIGPEQMQATLFVYDRQDAGPGCQGEECRWYRSKDFRVGGHSWNEITFDLDAENISDDSLKNILKIGIQFYSNISYSGKIFIDNVTVGGKEDIAKIANLNQGFVSRNGSDFELNGKPCRFAGNNVYYLFYKSHFMIDDVMDTMQRNGIEVLRTWAFGEGIPQNTDEAMSFQPEKGLYYEPVFVNFDYVIKSAGEHGIRLMLPLANYWSEFGGMAQYLEWCGIDKENTQAFYTDSNVKSAYKNYIKTVLNRVNTLTGIAYKDDPTIFAWELVNEPRCETCQNGEIYAWIKEMSQFVRSLDTKHLVGIGDEGFLRENGNADIFYNGHYGVDWEQNLGIGAVDFGTVHVYPELWEKDAVWTSEWISTHIRRAETVGKPIIFEEFGIKGANRDELYRQWTAQFENDSCLGADGDLVWMIAGKVNGPDDEHETIDGSYYYPDGDEFTLWEPETAMSIIRQHSENMRNLLYIKGDINRDGSVNLKDAVLALQICGNIAETSENICKNADINGDGSIGVQEAVYALNVSAAGILCPPKVSRKERRGR